MMSGRATPLTSLVLVVTSTLSGRSARRVPSASACDGVRSSISAPSASTPATLTRSAVPCTITQAEPSFMSVPSADSEICLVSGPPSLVSLVSSISSGGGAFAGAAPPLICRVGDGGGGAGGEGPLASAVFSTDGAGAVLPGIVLHDIPSSAMRRRMKASSQCLCSQRFSLSLSRLSCSLPSGGLRWHCAQI